MPVVLDNGSEALRTWLDPGRHVWTQELQSLLRPFAGALDVYPVHQDVGKVGNNSPTFIVPLDSKENKSNIANFFAKGAAKGPPQLPVKAGPGRRFVEDEDPAPRGSPEEEARPATAAGKSDGCKRAAEEDEGEDNDDDDNAPGHEPSHKKKKLAKPPAPPKGSRPKISATSNHTKSPEKPSQPGTQKITQFFGNSL